MKTKIVIHVHGGVVQSVYASKDVEVVLVDDDNLEDEFNRDQRENILDAEKFDCLEQSISDPDTSMV
jgi:hypothetical protein